jgi:molecular chaperone HtpG
MTLKGTLKIHSQNILPIIKKWLYSEKDIFVRELVSNASDAIRKLKILSDCQEASVKEEEFEIRVTIDKANKTLTFSDTGIGMDSEEVEKYIAQIAFSGAEEFVSKYSTNTQKDQIIGHFGLGFYSSYMVADKVEINTLSYKESASSVFWTCDGSSTYDMNVGTKKTRGTDIILHIGQANEEYLQEEKIEELLKRYCNFLPYPIFLNDKPLNNKEPLWCTPALDVSEEMYKEFYKKLYPFDEEPLFWVHLNVDYPFNLKGILYFPKIKQNFDFKKSQIQLFCNKVFVSESVQDLIPDYLMVLKGAIDSPDIPLNVSRSYLQMDKTVKQLATHISKKVADRLVSLFTTDKEAYYKAWPSIEIIIKLGAMHDDKFYERIKDILIWKNSSGEWTTLKDYTEKNAEKTKNKIFYAPGLSYASGFLDLYKKQNIEILFTDSLLDTALMSFLESKDSELKFQRVDGALEESLLEKTTPDEELNIKSKTESLALFIKEHVDCKNLEVEAKPLATQDIAAFIVIDEDSRRMRDYFAIHQSHMVESGMLPPVKQKLVVNTNSKIIEAMESLKDKDADLAKDVASSIFDLSLLAQKEVDPNDLSKFVAKFTKTLENLLARKV